MKNNKKNSRGDLRKRPDHGRCAEPIDPERCICAALLCRTLDALPARIAIVNRKGNVIFANESWRASTASNGRAELTGATLGENYIDVCREAADADDANAAAALGGIYAVLSGALPRFEMEYSVTTAATYRRILMTVVRGQGCDDSPSAVISHLEITPRAPRTRPMRERWRS